MPIKDMAVTRNPAISKPAAGAFGRFLKKLGPGLVTGVSDNDPSGIGTYSQVGAKFGYDCSGP